MADGDISIRLDSVESKVTSLEASLRAEVDSLKASIVELTRKVDGGAPVPSVDGGAQVPSANWELGELKVKSRGGGTLDRSHFTVMSPDIEFECSKESLKATKILKKTAVELFLNLCIWKTDSETFVYPFILGENETENNRLVPQTPLQPAPVTVLAVGCKKKRGALWTCIAESGEHKYQGLCAHNFEDRIVDLRKEAVKTFNKAIVSVLKVPGDFLVPNQRGQESFASRFLDESMDSDVWVDKLIPELKYSGAESGIVCIHQLNEYLKVYCQSEMPRGVVEAISGMYDEYVSVFRLPDMPVDEKIEYLNVWYHEVCYRVIMNGFLDQTIVPLPESDGEARTTAAYLEKITTWVDRFASDRASIHNNAINRYKEQYGLTDLDKEDNGKLIACCYVARNDQFI